MGRTLEATGKPLDFTEGFEQRSDMTWVLTGSLWPFCWQQIEWGREQKQGHNQEAAAINSEATAMTPGQQGFRPGGS